MFIILRKLRSPDSLGTSRKLGVSGVFSASFLWIVPELMNACINKAPCTWLKDKALSFACQDNILLGHAGGYKVPKQVMATLFRNGVCVGF